MLFLHVFTFVHCFSVPLEFRVLCNVLQALNSTVFVMEDGGFLVWDVILGGGS